MTRHPAWRAAFVIARRDYVASVWSRTFLFFLIGPLMPGIAVALFGSVGANMDRAANHPRVAVIADAADARALTQAHRMLAMRMGDALPELMIVPPKGGAGGQARALLGDGDQRVFAVLAGGLDAPTLTGPDQAIRETRRGLGLLIDRARADRALGKAGAALPTPVDMAERPVAQAAGSDASARMLTARLGQLLLMMLTMILTGMLLSNLIEEKSNKVIEVLAAAVPVDAIFFGKLMAMLAMSLTGIAIWGGTAGLLAFAFARDQLALMPAPAIGWPGFLALGIVYFCAVYLLLGAVFLGLGAQASSVREVQTMSMPVTMAQLGVVGFASSTLADIDGPMGMVAAVFPWSSPFAMLARAAEVPEWWPHLLAIAWQFAWIALIVKFAARLFRRSVLKSGGPRGILPWRRGRG